MIDKEAASSARKADLVAYLEGKGYKLKAEGRQWRVDGMAGLIVARNMWYWHSRQEGGNALDFAMRVEGLRFPDAVEALRGAAAAVAGYCAPTALEAPPRAAGNHRAVAYLVKTRGIDPKVLMPLVRSGTVYEAAGSHNCVFLGFDGAGAARYAHQRGSASWSRVRFDSRGSDKRFSFQLGAGGDAFVFESAIDLLSYLSLPGTAKPDGARYISLGGLTDLALARHAEGGALRSVAFCLDRDASGDAAYARMARKYRAAGIAVARLLPGAKDWNDMLPRPP